VMKALKLLKIVHTLCVSWWRQHLAVEHNILLSSLMIFQEQHMFILWNPKEMCLTNSKDTRCYWRMK
jgi:hypothetical protein